jgi:hypothetical protein
MNGAQRLNCLNVLNKPQFESQRDISFQNGPVLDSKPTELA